MSSGPCVVIHSSIPNSRHWDLPRVIVLEVEESIIIIALIVYINNRVLNICWLHCEHLRCTSPFQSASIPVVCSIIIIHSLQIRKIEVQRSHGTYLRLHSIVTELGFAPKQLAVESRLFTTMVY